MNLKQLRENAGMKQSELAVLAGVNLRSLQDYEQGHKSLYSAKSETLFRLSIALECSIEDILSECLTDQLIHEELERKRKKRIEAYARCYQTRRDTKVHFPIICADENVDMSRIYPTKQVAVKRVLDNLRGDENVLSLRLFGSSITMACHKDSDLDFAVGLRKSSRDLCNEVSEKIQKACDWGADIIWLDRLTQSDLIYKDIMKGLVLV